MPPPKPRYYVTTWDTERQEFTPQPGVRTGPYSLWSLKRALRKLQALGYSCARDDPSVHVEKANWWKDYPDLFA